MQPLKYAWLWLGGGVALVAAIIVLSLLPGGQLPQIGTWDKLEHAAAYVALAGWFGGVVTQRNYLRLGLALLLLGVLIEFAQELMGLGRTGDARDVLANIVGIALGLALAHLGVGRWMLEVERRLAPAN